MKHFFLAVIVNVFLFISVPSFAADAMTKSVMAVYTDQAQLKGKQVSVKGKVVKVNNGIMKRNFLHIQDGTGSEGTNDLIVTSDQTAKVGEEITVVGTVVLDTDFGFGYKYPLLVENAAITIAK